MFALALLESPGAPGAFFHSLYIRGYRTQAASAALVSWSFATLSVHCRVCGSLCRSGVSFGKPVSVLGNIGQGAALPQKIITMWRAIMKKLSVLGIIVGAALLSAAPFSLQWSQKNVALSLDSADARVGRPLTATSVAGVHRRAYRRAYRHGHYYYY